MKLINLFILGSLFVALCLWTVMVKAPSIEADIHNRTASMAALVNTLDVVVDGRNVRLRGSIRTHARPESLSAEVAELVQAMERLTGVRKLSANIELRGAGTQPALMLMLAGASAALTGES